MPKKLTITMDEEVYEGLHAVMGQGHISRFIKELVKPHVLDKYLEEAYRQMAEDEEREQEALDGQKQQLILKMYYFDRR